MLYIYISFLDKGIHYKKKTLIRCFLIIMDNSTSHIVMVPTAIMGHLTPMGEFAKKLLNHGVSTTFIIPTEGPLSAAQKSYLSTLPSAVNYVVLPPVSLDDLSPTVQPDIRFVLTLTRSLPRIRDAVKSIQSGGGMKLSAFVADLFTVDSFEIAEEYNIPKYSFFPSPAMILSAFLNFPKLDKMVSCDFKDVPGKLKIPGCIPMNGKDLLLAVQDKRNPAYKLTVHLGATLAQADVILVNSFWDLEPFAFEALQQKESGYPTVYPIGPLIQTGVESAKSSSDDDCLRWLDEQPTSSVLLISFGSFGALTHAQMTELALGLEMSEQKFLWVLRCPTDKKPNLDDPLAYLPEKFLERTKNRGLVSPSWVPQAQILAHDATSAFLTHCGWNSVLESVVNGVPLIAWPLYAEQKMNAVLLHEGTKVALRPSINGASGLVERVEICNTVKTLMEGREGKDIRSRTRGLKESSAAILGENGDLTSVLEQLSDSWRS